jgi:drug/metabolite transporter (DMT)-like permease
VLGILVATGSWGLHVAALSLAPISLVQSVIAGGLVLLTVTADRLFAHEVTRREWIGGGRDSYSDWDADRLVPWVGGLALGATLVAAASQSSRREGVLLGASAGLFWAASDTSIKALSEQLGDGVCASIRSRP